MRITLNINDDVLLTVKEIARQQGKTAGQILSDLVRHSLTRKPSVIKKNGLLMFKVQPDAKIVTLELVKKLLDETI